jgi:xanthine/uracil permease
MTGDVDGRAAEQLPEDPIPADGEVPPDRGILDVPFDGKVPLVQGTLMTLQNCFAIVGMFLFPAVLGATVGLKPEQVAELYGVTFIATGFGTVLQSTLGLKMPIVIGPWAATLAGLLATAKGYGLGPAFGSLFVAGLIWTVLALPIPHFSPIGYIARAFREPILYGGIVIIGIASLTNITVVNWIGNPKQPGFGAANWIGGLAAIVVITALIVLTRGFIRSAAMLFGIIAGALVYAIFKPISFTGVAKAHWVTAPTAFSYGFSVNGMLVVLFFLLLAPAVISSLGYYNVLAEWGDVRLRGHRMAWGIFGLSLAGVLAAALGTFTLSVYPDNLAIVRSSRIGSRWVTAAAGGLLIIAGFVTKFDALFTVVPSNVIGAGAVVLFGILFMAGVAAVSRVQWDQLNLLVIGLPFMLSIGGLFVSPEVIAGYPLIAREIITQPLFTGPLLLVFLHLTINKWARPRLNLERPVHPQRTPVDQPAPVRDPA